MTWFCAITCNERPVKESFWERLLAPKSTLPGKAVLVFWLDMILKSCGSSLISIQGASQGQGQIEIMAEQKYGETLAL